MFFGTNLQFLRRTNGNLTQEKLAQQLGVSRQTVSRWESAEAWPEIPKLLELCEVFGCTLDDLIRRDMTAGDTGRYPVEIRRVPAFRMAQYIIVSPDPKKDVREHLERWADTSGLTAIPGYSPRQIEWEFPYISAEQKSRFGLRGYAAAWILPNGFDPSSDGIRLCRQETADYAVMTLQNPEQLPPHRISHAYRLILDYIGSMGLKKSAKAGILPCFEYLYKKDGISCMDIFIHVEGTAAATLYTNFT